VIIRCSAGKFSRCKRLNRRMILEAHKALSTVKSYILVRVPSAVKLNVFFDKKYSLKVSSKMLLEPLQS
jgi:hypothetical protein